MREEFFFILSTNAEKAWFPEHALLLENVCQNFQAFCSVSTMFAIQEYQTGEGGGQQTEG